jgi:hypothetical protein
MKLVALLFVLALPAQAAPVQLAVKVVHAHDQNEQIDPKLAALVKEWKALKFKGYTLLDEATFALELLAKGRMQLPSGAWMTVEPREFAQDGKLRLELVIADMKFRTTALVGQGATVAVGGPPYDKGALILAVTRPPQ